MTARLGYQKGEKAQVVKEPRAAHYQNDDQHDRNMEATKEDEKGQKMKAMRREVETWRPRKKTEEAKIWRPRKGN